MKLPRHIAVTPPPTTGLVRADPRALTDTGDAGFGAIAGLGRSLSNIAHMGLDALVKRKRIDEDLRWGSGTTKTTEFTQGAIQAALDTDFTVDDPLPDSDNYLKSPQQLSVEKWNSLVGDAMTDYDKATGQIRQSFLTEDEKKRYDNHIGLDRVGFQKNISKAYRDKLHAYEKDRLQSLATTAYRNGDTETGDSYIASMDENELITPERATQLKSQGREFVKKSMVENIKPLLIDAIEAEDKQAGLAVLRGEVNRLVEEGILTRAEAAETDKVLGDWMDNFVAGREQKAKDAIKLTTRESYQELMPVLFDSQQADQRYDAIDQSRLLKADKDQWREYAKGSYKQSPQNNTPKGHKVAYNAVFDANTLQVSPTEAYDILLEARFINHSITDETFNWALDKVENPYPKKMIGDINNAVNNNLNNYNSMWRIDDPINLKINESLIAWIDDLVESEQVPKFDFAQKLHAQSTKLRWGKNSFYDIGQIIERGGVSWEIIEFDKDGEPIVEEVR